MTDHNFLDMHMREGVACSTLFCSCHCPSTRIDQPPVTVRAMACRYLAHASAFDSGWRQYKERQPFLPGVHAPFSPEHREEKRLSHYLLVWVPYPRADSCTYMWWPARKIDTPAELVAAIADPGCPVRDIHEFGCPEEYGLNSTVIVQLIDARAEGNVLRAVPNHPLAITPYYGRVRHQVPPRRASRGSTAFDAERCTPPPIATPPFPPPPHTLIETIHASGGMSLEAVAVHGDEDGARESWFGNYAEGKVDAEAGDRPRRQSSHAHSRKAGDRL